MASAMTETLTLNFLVCDPTFSFSVDDIKTISYPNSDKINKLPLYTYTR